MSPVQVVERGMDWCGARWWRFVDNAVQRINTLNMTNTRQALTLGLVGGTGIVYLGLAIKDRLITGVDQWVPDYQWLAFLGVMSGLDITQFRLKRTTDHTFVANKAARESGAIPQPPGAQQ